MFATNEPPVSPCKPEDPSAIRIFVRDCLEFLPDLDIRIDRPGDVQSNWKLRMRHKFGGADVHWSGFYEKFSILAPRSLFGMGQQTELDPGVSAWRACALIVTTLPSGYHLVWGLAMLVGVLLILVGPLVELIVLLLAERPVLGNVSTWLWIGFASLLASMAILYRGSRIVRRRFDETMRTYQNEKKAMPAKA